MKRKKLTFVKAINSAQDYILSKFKNSLIIGQGVDRPKGVFGTTDGLVKKFSNKQVVDFPICESLMTSVSIRMANNGLRPIIIHQRVDFALYSFDALVNWMSIWRFKSGGESNLPIVIRAVIGRGWGQGPQHAKPLYPMLTGIPGLKVCIPTTPFDVKGILISAFLSNDPVLIFEHRSLYNLQEEVPIAGYALDLEHERIRNIGTDLTVVCIGDVSNEVLNLLKNEKILNKKVEVIDLVGIYPLKLKKIIKSIQKTKKLLIVEPSWSSMGVSSTIFKKIFFEKKLNIKKNNFDIITFKDTHVAAGQKYEKDFYIKSSTILTRIKKLLK